MADRSEELAIIVRVQDLGSKALRSVNRELGGLEKGAWGAARATSRGIGNAVGNIERLAVVAGGAAITAGGAAVKMAMDYESSAASVRKTVNGDVTGILAEIRKMATTTPVDVNDLNEIAAAAGALGVAKEDIVDFTKTVALLGVTTDLSTEAAATSLGHLKTTLKLTGDDFHELGDEIVYLGNNGASTESEITAMAESIAGAANAVGASKEQVVGWASAMASAGEEAEAGGSSIQRFWIESFKTVNEGGKGLKLMAKISGTTAAQFKKDFGKDATGTLANFIVHLGKLSKAEQLATLENLGFTDIRVTRAMLKLLGNTDNLTQSLYDAQHAAGAMGKEAEQRFKTTASQVQLFKNNVKDAAITIGSELLPEINDLLKMGTTALQQHPGEIKAFAHDLGQGFHDAVVWAEKLDWPGIARSAREAAGAAQGVVTAFVNAPDWLKTAVITGWGLNKLTGGAVVDVGVSLSKGVIGQLAGQFVGRGSSPANPMWVASVNGGVGGVPGIGGAGGASLLGRLLTGAAGLGLGIGGSALLGAGIQSGGPGGAGMGALGGAGMIAGGALLAGPLGAILGAGLAVGQTVTSIQSQSKAQGDAIASSIQAQIAGGAKLSDLKTSLAAVNTGIHDIESNPIQVLLAGDALDQLKAQRAALEQQVQQQANVTPAVGNATPKSFAPGGGLSGKEKDDRDIRQFARAVSAEFRGAIKELERARKPEDIKAAVEKLVTKIVSEGKGNVASTKAGLAALKAQLANTHDPKLQAILRTAIHQVEAKIPGREYAEAQIRKAEQIVHGTQSNAEKIRGLQAIERDLKNRGLPTAAKGIRDRINAVKHSVDILPGAIAAYMPKAIQTGRSGQAPPAPKPKPKPSGGGGGGGGGKVSASGRVETVSSPTEYLAGDAGTEHVVILRNARRGVLARPAGLMSAAAARATVIQIHATIQVISRPVVGLRELKREDARQLSLGKVYAG